MTPHAHRPEDELPTWGVKGWVLALFTAIGMVIWAWLAIVFYGVVFG